MTLLSSQQWVDMGWLPSASRTLAARLAAICPTMSSNLGIVKFRLDRRDLAVTSPCVDPDSWATTAYTAAQTPCLLASPNAWRSMDCIGSLNGAIGRSTVTHSGRSLPFLPFLAEFSWDLCVPGQFLLAHVSEYKFPTQRCG